MESLVDAGERDLEPLLILRDYLKEIRNKPGARYDLRRNGQAPLNRHTGEIMTNTGPFTHEARRDLLRRLLESQRDSGITLIEGDELAAIQEIWRVPLLLSSGFQTNGSSVPICCCENPFSHPGRLESLDRPRD